MSHLITSILILICLSNHFNALASPMLVQSELMEEKPDIEIAKPINTNHVLKEKNEDDLLKKQMRHMFFHVLSELAKQNSQKYQDSDTLDKYLQTREDQPPTIRKLIKAKKVGKQFLKSDLNGLRHIFIGK